MIHLSNKYIPLSLCKEGGIYCGFPQPSYVIQRNKSNMFTDHSDTERSVKISTGTIYVNDEYILMSISRDGCSVDILAIVCKKSNNDVRIPVTIPDKSEWVVLRNKSLSHEKSLIDRFISNYLEMEKEQVVGVTDEEMRKFRRPYDLTLSMQMYLPEWQKEFSIKFLNAYRESLAV